MDLLELITPSNILFGVRASNKEQLLHDLASRAAQSLNLDQKVIFDALQAREQLGSTGLGDGFALPHARVEGLEHFFGMFVRLNRPIQFDSVDDKAVDLIFVLLIPMTAQSEHLAALAAICRHMRDKEFATKLRKAASAAALCALLCVPQQSQP
jgi:nitrogen PTS system EIIA component